MTTDDFVFICKTDESKQVKQEVNCTVILPPLVFPGLSIHLSVRGARYRMGENLKVVWAEFSTLSYAVLINRNMSR
jgi:hypothetical protein